MFWAFSNPCVKILHGLHVSTQQYKFHHPKCSTFIVHAKQTKQVCVLDHQMQTCELICIFLFSLHGKVQFDFLKWNHLQCICISCVFNKILTSKMKHRKYFLEVKENTCEPSSITTIF